MSRTTTSTKIAIFLALALSVCAQHEDTMVPESTQDVEPIELVESAAEEAQNAAAHQEANAYLQKAGTDACKSLADATEKTVQDNVKTQQSMLSKMDDGSKCLQEGQDVVSAMKKALNEAEDNKKKAIKAHDDADSADVDFGSRKYISLNKGNCGTFFDSQAYKNAEKKVAAAKKKMDQANGKVKEAKKSLKTAEAAAKSAVHHCQCHTFAAHKEARAKFDKEIQSSNTKAWTKAAHLKCVLEGKALNKCTVPPLPKVTAVKLAAGIDARHCPPPSLWKGKTKQCKNVAGLTPREGGFIRPSQINQQYMKKYSPGHYIGGCYLGSQINVGEYDYKLGFWPSMTNQAVPNKPGYWFSSTTGITNGADGNHYHGAFSFAFTCKGPGEYAIQYERLTRTLINGGGVLHRNGKCKCSMAASNTNYAEIIVKKDGSVEWWFGTGFKDLTKCRSTPPGTAKGSYVVDTSFGGMRSAVSGVYLQVKKGNSWVAAPDAPKA